MKLVYLLSVFLILLSGLSLVQAAPVEEKGDVENERKPSSKCLCMKWNGKGICVLCRP
jgi:hypothetical protein